MKLRSSSTFYLNGIRMDAQPEHAKMMLSDYLRYQKLLTGTKVVCAEGDCGACSVLKYFPKPKSNSKAPRFLAINSCITTVAQVDGSSLVTVDALSKENEMHPVQKAMVECHGSQCGFCTPGFVVALTGLVEKKICEKKTGSKHLTVQETKNALTGNLCRCTGYQPIIESARAIDLTECESIADRFYSKAQENDLKKIQSQPYFIKSDSFECYAPTSLKDAVKFLAKNKNVRLMGAGTDLGVVSNKRKIKLDKLLSLHLIKDLYEVKKSGSRVSVGARVTLSELRRFLVQYAPEFSRFLDLFASPQIKNSATLIGNVGNASPIADTPPFLLVSRASVHVIGPRGKRKIAFDEFYLGYRKTALKPGEIITSIEFESNQKNETVALYKSSQRKDLDISAVNAAFRFKFKDSKKSSVSEAFIAMGGVGPTPLRFKKTEKLFKGAVPSDELLKKAIATLHTEMTPLSDLRGSAAFRRVIATNLFMKFFRELK